MVKARKPKTTTRRKGKKKGSSPLRHVTSTALWITLAVVGAILLFFVGKLVVDNAFVIRAKFGDIVYPEGDVRGIDISHYQEDIDWDRLRNAELNGVPIRFIFIKATEGTNIIDENFNHNFYHARGNGFVRGAYHFFSTSTDPIQQAKHYCKIVQLDPEDIAPILERVMSNNDSVRFCVNRCVFFCLLAEILNLTILRDCGLLYERTSSRVSIL